MPNPVNLALSDRKIGILSVLEGSASSLSMHETKGQKAVVHDSLEADPPCKSIAMGRMPAL